MLNAIMQSDVYKQERLSKPWQGTLACLGRLLLRYAHNTTTLKLLMTRLGQVDPGSRLRPRIVTSVRTIFEIAPQQHLPQPLKSLAVEEFLIRQSAIVSGRQGFLLKDRGST